MTERPAEGPAERLGRALVELTRRPEARVEDPVVLLEQVPPADLVDLACHHRVPGVVHRSLAALGIEDPALDGLRAAYQMAALAHGRCLVDLAAMADTLAELAQPWLVVKGPGAGRDRLRRSRGPPVRGPRPGGGARPTCRPRWPCSRTAGGHVTDLNWPT